VRVLPDVNILVRANEKSQGPARSLLLAVILDGHTLLVCDEMLVDLARVLRYPRMQDRYALTEAQIYEYIQFLRASSEIVTVDRTLNVPMRDPKDIVILQTAIAGEAEVICTLDSDFYDPRTLAFCATWGIAMCTDVALMNRLRAS
jgi:putative PIN family toxin of toxin-antitoxin system